MPEINALFNAMAQINHGLERSHLRLKKTFRDFGIKQAAKMAEKYFTLPRLHSITSFHMPTIEARKQDDHVLLIERGSLVFRDPLREYTRIFAAYDENDRKWTVTRQRLKVYQSELEQGIDRDKGRIERFEFGANGGHDALACAEKLFEDEYYQPNPPGTPQGKKIYRTIADDNYPPKSLMAYIVRHIANIEAGTASRAIPCAQSRPQLP